MEHRLGQPPPPPPGLPVELTSRWQQVRKLLQDLQHAGPAALVAQRTSDAARSDDPQRVLLSCIKDLHPDRLPAELQALRPWAEAAVRQLNEWLATSMSGNSFAGVDSSVGVDSPVTARVSGTVPSPAAQQLAALALELEKAEWLVRSRDFSAAIAVIESLLQRGLDSPQAHALLGWVLFQQHGVTQGAPIAAMFAHVDRALMLQPDSERAHWTKALLLKQLGQSPAAMTHFRRVLEISPDHLDARREVRLAERRSTQEASAPTSTAKPSWARWFRSKKS